MRPENLTDAQYIAWLEKEVERWMRNTKFEREARACDQTRLRLAERDLERMMTTDKQRLDWICENITYLEHKVKGVHPRDLKKGGYWPQTESDLGTPDTQLLDMDLIDYIDAHLP